MATFDESGPWLDGAGVRQDAGVFDFTDTLIAVLDPDGTIREINRPALAFCDLKREAVLGRPVRELAHDAESGARLADAVGRAALGESVRFRSVASRGPAAGRVVDLCVHPIRDGDGIRGVLVEGHDVSDAASAEHELQVSREKFAGIVAISSDAIISIEESGRITDFNLGAEQLFGWSPAEVVGQPLEMLMPERFRATHWGHVRAFGESAIPARRMGERREIAGLRKNGEEFPAEASISKLDLDGERIYTVVLRDVTVRKRAESVQRFLARAGNLLVASLDTATTYDSVARLSTDSLADACVIFERCPDGAVLRVAVAASDPERESRLSALRGTELLDPGHPVMRVLDTGEAIVWHDMAALTAEAEASGHEHARLLRQLPVTSMLIVPLVARGRVIGAIGLYSCRAERSFGPEEMALAHELGVRSALAVDNARLYEEARNAIRARDEVLAVVSHDLGNPLSAIRVGVSLLLRDASAHDQTTVGRDHLVGIRQSAEQMERLIRDLLDVNRIEAGHLTLNLESVSPAALAASVVEMFADLAATNELTLHSLVAPDLEPIEADRTRLIQAMSNLVGNAIKFTPPGGRVEIGVEAEPDELRFIVTDDGPGIDPADLTHIFDRFWRARRGRGGGVGLGLGLAIVKGIAQAHGGRAWAESAPGRGTAVRLAIPVRNRISRAP